MVMKPHGYNKSNNRITTTSDTTRILFDLEEGLVKLYNRRNDIFVLVYCAYHKNMEEFEGELIEFGYDE